MAHNPLASVGFAPNRSLANFGFTRTNNPVTLRFEGQSTDGSTKIDGKIYYVYLVTVIGSSCKYFPATASQIDKIKKQLENSWGNFQKENKEAPAFRDLDRFECKWHFLEDRSTIDSDQNPSISFIRKGKPVENVSWSLSNICFSEKINLVAKQHLCDELKKIISSGSANNPLLTTKV